MNQQVLALTNQITGLDGEIAKEMAKLQGDTQDEREEVQRRLQAAETECETAKQELTDIEGEREAANIQLEQIRAQGQQSDRDIARAQQDIEAATSNIQQCQNQGSDDLSPFGRNLQNVLTRINNERWAGEVRFISVKDSKWAMLMRTQLGQSMSSFAVTDNRDRHKLKQILEQNGKYVIIVIVSSALVNVSLA